MVFLAWGALISKIKGIWYGFIGAVAGIFGAFILAVDKRSLCLVLSAFDTLPDAQFAQVIAE